MNIIEKYELKTLARILIMIIPMFLASGLIFIMYTPIIYDCCSGDLIYYIWLAVPIISVITISIFIIKVVAPKENAITN